MKKIKTWQAKTEEWQQEGARRWWLVDASDETLGRLAARIAPILRGKHRPTFTPHVDTGDFVIVVQGLKSASNRSKMATKNILSAFPLYWISKVHFCRKTTKIAA